jgi:hypothetical protein
VYVNPLTEKKACVMKITFEASKTYGEFKNKLAENPSGSLYSPYDPTHEEVASSAYEIATVLQASATESQSSKVLKPFNDGFLIEGCTAKDESALVDEGYIVMRSGTVALARKTTTKKTSKTTRKATQPAKVTAPKEPNNRLVHLADPAAHRIGANMFKRMVTNGDYAQFTSFMSALDGLIESYRVKCGHESTCEESTRSDDYEGEDDPILASTENETVGTSDSLEAAFKEETGAEIQESLSPSELELVVTPEKVMEPT